MDEFVFTDLSEWVVVVEANSCDEALDIMREAGRPKPYSEYPHPAIHHRLPRVPRILVSGGLGVFKVSQLLEVDVIVKAEDPWEAQRIFEANLTVFFLPENGNSFQTISLEQVDGSEF